LKWEKSQERKDWLEKTKDVIEGEDKVQVYWLRILVYP
jgi:antibiotic biosynthesis monooxygenase (ABM) superfamily enzyme